jgi:anti-sigma regulatory factor (Ser/Thr protein kinase)
VARTFVARELAGWGLGYLSDDAELLVSELVTNAYQHAPGPESFELEISADDERVRLSLADGSSTRPVLAEPHPSAARGRGIRIVATIATRWGADNYLAGKRVWAELALDPALG